MLASPAISNLACKFF